MFNAIETGNVDKVLQAIHAGYPLNFMDFYPVGVPPYNALDLALSRGTMEIVQLLLDNGATFSDNCIDIAVSWNTTEMVEMLLDHGADFSDHNLDDAADVGGTCSNIMHMALWNSPDMVRTLRKHGVPLTEFHFVRDGHNTSLMEDAAIRNRPDMVELLQSLVAN